MTFSGLDGKLISKVLSFLVLAADKVPASMENYMFLYYSALTPIINLGVITGPVNGISAEIALNHFKPLGRYNLGCERRGQGLSNMFSYRTSFGGVGFSR